MDKLRVVLDWFPNTNHTGYLLAQKRGWFKEAGLDIELHGEVHGNMEIEGTDFVCGPEIAMLVCMKHGIEMTCIATMTQKCDSGIVSLKEANITRPSQLEGKRLSHWNPEWYHAAIGTLVEKDGGDYSKVKLVNMDVGNIVDVLGKTVDATWVYENWENEELIEAGKEINYFNLADFDPIYDFCAPSMAATHKILKDKPDAVRRFLKVLDLAYRDAAKNPDKCVLEVKEYMPKNASEDMLIRSQRHLAPILLDEKGRWGRIKAQRWDRMADLMLKKGVILERKEKEYTNEFFED